MNRGRRDADACAVGDAIDGWTVEAFEPDRRLRLSANLKLPGHGWLEFEVTPLDTGQRSMIRQTATFDPRGWMGRAYWYAILPLHALIFRGLLRQVARRALHETAPTHPATFAYCSIIGAPAAEVFRWHEQPGALAALTPPALVRIEEQEGGIRDDGRVTLSIGIGPARVRWMMRHYGYVVGRRFCDEQVRGPFAVWRHAHLFEPIGPSQTLHQDRTRVRGVPSWRSEPCRSSRAPTCAHPRVRAPPSNRARQRRPPAFSGRAPIDGGGRCCRRRDTAAGYHSCADGDARSHRLTRRSGSICG